MLDPAWRWLHKEPAPKLLRAALADAGVKETPGKASNPVILQWAKELGLEKDYTNDETPWCGLAVAHWVQAAGYEPVRSPLWALNWKTWGNPADRPMLGDVLVFKRKLTNGGVAGHVGIYIGEDADSFAVLGGNQSDKVCITWIAKSRFVAARRSPWRVQQPPNVRVVRLRRSGSLSVNEA